MLILAQTSAIVSLKRADTVAGGDYGSERGIASGRGGERGEGGGGGDPRLQCVKLQLCDGPDTCNSRYV